MNPMRLSPCPIHTFFQILGGNIPDQLSLGGDRWFDVVLYWSLLIGSLTIAYANWRMDETQRTGTHISIYAMRLVSAGMVPVWAVRVTIRLLTMLGALSLTRERETATWETMLTLPVGPLDVLAGKIAPYVVVGTLQRGWCWGSGRRCSGCPSRAVSLPWWR